MQSQPDEQQDTAESLELADAPGISGGQRSVRQQALLGLVMQNSFQTQEALQEALQAKGFVVTQSSISRDIRALRLEKRGGVYVAPREFLAGPAGLEVWQTVIDVCAAGPNLVVVRCMAAMAMAVAAALDDGHWPGVAGTVAGDDTILIALSDSQAQATIMRRVQVLSGKGHI
jgi:transcriptional regulator of arginine metabolism